MRFNLSQDGTRHFINEYQGRFVQNRSRQIFQVSGRLGKNALPLSEVFEEVRSHVLTWMKQQGVQVPIEAWEGQDFELDAYQGHPPASAISVESSKGYCWAAQYVGDDTQVPGRKWITEIAVTLIKGEPFLSLRQTRVFRLDDPPFAPSVPRFLRNICTSPGLFDDGFGFDVQPWLLESESNLQALLSLIQNPSRTRPVILITLPNGTDNPRDALVNPYTIAKQCLGLVHVAVLGPNLSWRWSNIIGRDFSAFDGAVLTYQPGFSLQDEPYNHPKVLPARIQNWEKGAKGFELFLINKIYQATVQQLASRFSLPTFAEVKREALNVQQIVEEKRGAAGLEDLVAIEKLKNEQLEDERDNWFSLAAELDEDLQATKEKLAENEQETLWLKARIHHLEHRFKEGKGMLPEEAELPTSFDKLEEWAAQELSGRVFIMNRALREARKSQFSNVKLVYQALLLLANEYWAMRANRTEFSYQEFKKRLAELGILEDASFGGSGAGEEGDNYYVTWQSRKRYLDRHIKDSNSREPRFCLRIYFFWDEERQTVVVGWLPSHLPNRMT